MNTSPHHHYILTPLAICVVVGCFQPGIKFTTRDVSNDVTYQEKLGCKVGDRYRLLVPTAIQGTELVEVADGPIPKGTVVKISRLESLDSRDGWDPSLKGEEVYCYGLIVDGNDAGKVVSLQSVSFAVNADPLNKYCPPADDVFERID